MKIINFLLVTLFLSCSTVKDAPREIAPANYQISVLGDIEGNWERYWNFITRSGTFSNVNGQPVLKEGMKFIFMGDSLDKGPGQIRILKSLVTLKKKYPDRVTLIIGNRDMNKIGFLRNAKVPNEIKPILQNTMNAPKALEFYQDELTILRGKKISEEEVLDFLFASVRPGGIIFEFLQLGEVMHLELGTLFVHGSVQPTNFGCIPTLGCSEHDVDLWLYQLNSWKNAGLAQWQSKPELLQSMDEYARPTQGEANNEKSVMYSRYSLKENGYLPMMPSSGFLNDLKEQGIFRIVVAHTPAGDVPLIMRQDGFEIIGADTSYSNVKTPPTILLSSNRTLVTGTLETGEKIKTDLPLNAQSPVGQKSLDGHRIIQELSDGRYLMYKVGDAFQILYKEATKEEIKL